MEEGDCRYMPREILLEDYHCLAKADMFALGLTALECACGQPLPKNGEPWQALRDGVVPPLPGFSDDFRQLIQVSSGGLWKWWCSEGWLRDGVVPPLPGFSDDFRQLIQVRFWGIVVAVVW